MEDRSVNFDGSVNFDERAVNFHEEEDDFQRAVNFDEGGGDFERQESGRTEEEKSFYLETYDKLQSLQVSELS
ncbi:hypothetical protein T484DRAFT_1872453 [Baffinella frigidus]|nr:hypothetical protein T484DRAFT_1872453 [Cryptophyta sp. CCMP2293]